MAITINLEFSDLNKMTGQNTDQNDQAQSTLWKFFKMGVLI